MRRVIIILALFCLVHFVSAANVPYVVSTVENSTQGDYYLDLPTITGIAGDIAIVAVGASTGSTIDIDGVTPGFTRLGGGGDNRRAEMWWYQSLESESVTPRISDDLNITLFDGIGLLVRGATDDAIAKTQEESQVVTYNVSYTFETQRNNSLILLALYRGTGIGNLALDGDAVEDIANGAGRLWIISKNATTAGNYTIGANFTASTASSAVILEIASEIGSSVTPSEGFNATNITSYNLAQQATALYNSSKVNILWMGDSVAVPAGRGISRWPAGFMRTFNHTTGWYSVSTGTATSTTSFIRRTVEATFTGNNTYADYGVRDNFWGSFYGSLWHGLDTVMSIKGAFPLPSNGRVMSWWFDTSDFEVGNVPDWISTANLHAQFGYTYDSDIGYADYFGLANDTSVYRIYNTTDTTYLANGTLRDKRLNLVSDKIPLNSSTKRLYLTNLSGTPSYYFDASIVRFTDEDNPSGIQLDTLAQSSTSYIDFLGNARPTVDSKQFLHSDLEDYLRDTYVANNRTDGDNFVFIAMGPETGAISTQVDRWNNIINNLTEIYSNAGLNQPRFILVSSYRTFTEDNAIVQSEVFWNVSHNFNNVGMASMYGKSEGILLNISAEQQAWFSRKGYDNIVLNNGSVLNLSTTNLIDTSSGIHQASPEAAFFFAYLLEDELVDNLIVNNDSTAPLVTINSPSNGFSGELPVSISVTLDETGSVNYSINSGSTNSTLSSSDNLTFSGEISGIDEGDYILNIYAQDDLGNSNNTESVAFTISSGANSGNGNGNGGGGFPPSKEIFLTLSYNNSWNVSEKNVIKATVTDSSGRVSADNLTAQFSISGIYYEIMSDSLGVYTIEVSPIELEETMLSFNITAYKSTKTASKSGEVIFIDDSEESVLESPAGFEEYFNSVFETIKNNFVSAYNDAQVNLSPSIEKAKDIGRKNFSLILGIFTGIATFILFVIFLERSNTLRKLFRLRKR